MMKYNEIANIKSEKMQCSVEALSSFLEDLYKSHPEEVEKELIKQVGIFIISILKRRVLSMLLTR
jgi:hypothetical protein